jgi:putative PLP-dependent aminotransferase (TIGR04422 family)
MSYFLWPEAQYPSFKDIFRRTREGTIESVLQSYWPDTYPVLFSSARSGLTAILQHINLSRPDLVWCAPYSSHCVFESIARVATPITVESRKIRAAVIYHQWGFSSTHKWPKKVTIIEDSVDTLFIPKTNIFSAGGSYVLQSLPKVYGCTSGGVVFCRNADDAKALKVIRKERGSSRLQTVLRILSHKSSAAHLYWHGSESLQGSVSNIALSQILRKVNLLPNIVNERLDFLNKISPVLAKNSNDTGRIPSNIPIKITTKVKDVWCNNNIFSAGLVNFNISRTVPNVEWKIVAPLPVHIDICINKLYKFLPLLKYKTKNQIKDELGFF